MSNAWVEENFTAATIDGAGDLDDGELAPADILGHVVFSWLLADSKLQAMFPTDQPNLYAMDRLPFRQPFKFANYPRLQVYPAMADADQRPTKVEHELIDVFIAITHRADEVKKVASHVIGAATQTYKATGQSALHYVRQILRNRRQATVQVNGGDVHLAQNSDPSSIRQFPDFEADPLTPSHYTWELGWRYECVIDQETGRFVNILRAL